MALKIRTGYKQLSGSGSGTLTIDVPGDVSLTIKRFIQSSTGNYNITDARDSASGVRFLTGTTPHTHFETDNNANLELKDEKLEFKGPTKITFELTDTSTSTNNVYMTAICDE